MQMMTRAITREFASFCCFAVVASPFAGEIAEPLTPELEELVSVVSSVPEPFDLLKEHSDWEGKMKALARGSRMGTNLWPVIPALVTLAGHTNIQVSVTAATLLANARPEEHPRWNHIQEQLHSTTNAYRGLEYLVHGPDAYLRTYSPRNRKFGITAIGIIGPPAKSTARTLIRVLESKAEIDLPLWGDTATALHRMAIDSSAYLPVLRKRFADSDEDLVPRATAAHALACAKASDAETIALLRGGLDDSYSQVRLAAARALLLLGHPLDEVQSTLAALLKHKLVSMRSGALRVLAEIGPAASPLRSEITSLLEDNAPAVRTAAQEALQSLSHTPESAAAEKTNDE